MDCYEELRSILSSRFLIWNFFIRDVRGRYAGSVLGLFWSVINPLILIVILTFIFSTVLKVRFTVGGGVGEYVLYLFSGMLPWLAFQESLLRSTQILLQHSNLIKKYSFPVKILPVHLILSALFNHCIGVVILVVILIATDRPPGLPLLVFPLVLLIQFLLTAGLSWLLSTVNVFLRDITHLVGALLLAWMYATPIFYPEEMVPAHFRWLLWINPLSHIIHAYRRIFLEGRFPDLSRLGFVLCLSMVLFFAGILYFHRHQGKFADLV